MATIIRRLERIGKKAKKIIRVTGYKRSRPTPIKK